MYLEILKCIFILNFSLSISSPHFTLHLILYLQLTQQCFCNQTQSGSEEVPRCSSWIPQVGDEPPHRHVPCLFRRWCIFLTLPHSHPLFSRSVIQLRLKMPCSTPPPPQHLLRANINYNEQFSRVLLINPGQVSTAVLSKSDPGSTF